MNIFRGLSGKFIIPYVLTLIFGVWTYLTIRRIDEYNEVKSSLQDIQIKVLEMRKHEKDFLAREYKNIAYITKGESEYKIKLNQLVSHIKEETSELRTFNTISNHQLDSMGVLLEQYALAFNNLALLIKEKGFKDHGLEGKLRQAIHDVEDADLKYDRSYMLMLRRHEKDFFLRKDLKYWDKFESGIVDFKTHISSLGIADADFEKEILRKIDEYSHDFKRVVEIQTKIGLSENHGLHGQLRTTIHNFTPFLDQMIASHSEYLNHEIRKNEIVLIVLFVFIFIIGAFILFTHIKKITRNINLINQNTLMLSQGKFPKEQKVNSRDELGKAHHSINTLTSGLKAKTQFAKDIGEGRLDAYLETLGENDILGRSLLNMRNNLSGVIGDINQTIEDAGEKGLLGSRISLNNKERYWKTISISINRLLEAFANPIYIIDDIVKAMAKGDFTKQYDKNAKGDIKILADNLNVALSNLNEFLLKISINAKVVEESSVKMMTSSADMNQNMSTIAATTTQMSHGAHSQVSKVDESSNLIESIMTSFDHMNHKSEAINGVVMKGVEDCDHGVSIVKNLVENTAEISQLTHHTFQSIEQLKMQSGEISRVLNLINEIATQTNLLALNASIEAAQAGDAGRGFAVVADEIRKLADDSRNSVQEIEKLIKDVQSGTKLAAKDIDAVKQSIDENHTISVKAREVFEQISTSSKNTLLHSRDILHASQEKKSELGRVASIIEEIVIVAQQAATGSEELAGSALHLTSGMTLFESKSNRLSIVASNLSHEVSKFKLKGSLIEELVADKENGKTIFS